jgi:hypothetical protein
VSCFTERLSAKFIIKASAMLAFFAMIVSSEALT